MSGRKVVTHNSKSDLPLVIFFICKLSSYVVFMSQLVVQFLSVLCAVAKREHASVAGGGRCWARVAGGSMNYVVYDPK